jgi:hypothetical protein
MDAIFRGASGRLHRFEAHHPSGALPEQAGVYMFARPASEGLRWTPLFLSRTANVGKRFAGHERWEEARRLGATHVLVHAPQDRDAREAVEADLLASLRPVLNGPCDAGAAVAVMHAQAGRAAA